MHDRSGSYFACVFRDSLPQGHCLQKRPFINTDNVVFHGTTSFDQTVSVTEGLYEPTRTHCPPEESSLGRYFVQDRIAVGSPKRFHYGPVGDDERFCTKSCVQGRQNTVVVHLVVEDGYCRRDEPYFKTFHTTSGFPIFYSGEKVSPSPVSFRTGQYHGRTDF